jgi:hypothetical protein
VARKNRKFSQKEVPRKMAKVVPKEGAEIKHQCLNTWEVCADNFDVHASWEARWPNLSSIQGVV